MGNQIQVKSWNHGCTSWFRRYYRDKTFNCGVLGEQSGLKITVISQDVVGWWMFAGVLSHIMSCLAGAHISTFLILDQLMLNQTTLFTFDLKERNCYSITGLLSYPFPNLSTRSEKNSLRVRVFFFFFFFLITVASSFCYQAYSVTVTDVAVYHAYWPYIMHFTNRCLHSIVISLQG